jgi:hypothetical protein
MSKIVSQGRGFNCVGIQTSGLLSELGSIRISYEFFGRSPGDLRNLETMRKTIVEHFSLRLGR